MVRLPKLSSLDGVKVGGGVGCKEKQLAFGRSL